MFAAEMEKARSLFQAIPKDTVLPHLVAHRGFHYSTTSKNWQSRPTENSLIAYEKAFKLGLHLAECDITITRDGELILCHDEDFMRVSMQKRKDVEGLKVNSQTCKFLQSNVVLQDGSTPPTLAEALAVCKAYGTRMIVELKPECMGLSERVLDFFILNPDLLEQVELFISFNRDTITMLARAMKRALRDVPRLPKFLFIFSFSKKCDQNGKSFGIADMQRLHSIIRKRELDGVVIGHDTIGGRPTEETVAFSEEFKEFLECYNVGIFGLPASGNDRLEYVKRLISQGFAYVNIDLSLDFLALEPTVLCS